MAYKKQKFVDDETIVTAEILQHIESGIVEGEEQSISEKAIGLNPVITNSIKAQLIYAKFKGFTKQSEVPTPSTPFDVVGLGNSGSFIMTTSNKDTSQSTQAIFPLTAPLYAGDYLEVYTDGSGKVVRNFKEVTLTGNESWFAENNYYKSSAFASKSGVLCYCNYLKGVTTYNEIDTISGTIYASTYGISINMTGKVASLSEFVAWLKANTVKVVYPLPAPVETALTAEQVAQFKKLYSFDEVTNVVCESDVEVTYYKMSGAGKLISELGKSVADGKSLLASSISQYYADVASSDTFEQLNTKMNNVFDQRFKDGHSYLNREVIVTYSVTTGKVQIINLFSGEEDATLYDNTVAVIKYTNSSGVTTFAVLDFSFINSVSISSGLTLNYSSNRKLSGITLGVTSTTLLAFTAKISIISWKTKDSTKNISVTS